MSNSVKSNLQVSDPYWRTQAELVRLLGVIGFGFDISDRLPVFWLRLRIGEVNENVDQELVNEVVRKLDELVELRKGGGEPAHNGRSYT